MTTGALALNGYFDDLGSSLTDFGNNDVPVNTGFSSTNYMPSIDYTAGTSTTGATITASSGGGNKFESTMVGGVLGTLLSNGGNIAQVISAVKGNAPAVQDANGDSHDITALKAEIERLSVEKNQDSGAILQMMAQQLNKEKPAPAKKDNTALYIGLGVGALVLLGGVFFVTTKKSKK